MEIQEFYLYIAFGLPTWTLVDGTWAVLSQLADTLPEGYNISAYLILSLTLGNIFPLVIGFMLRKTSFSYLAQVINVILATGLVTGILMGAVWNRVVTIGDSEVSLPIFLLFFIVGGCSSSSNVTHFTYVSKSEAQNTTALATGMGLGSMTAGILALFQGLLLHQYGFSVTIFYIVLAMLYVPALFAFAKLHSAHRQDFIEESSISNPISTEFMVDSDRRDLEATGFESMSVDTETKLKNVDAQYSESSFLRLHGGILALQLINSSLGYGFVPALISSACGKFNNASLVLLLATGITAVLDPMFKFLTNYTRFETFGGLKVATCVLVCLTVGLILCAALPGDLSLYRGDGGALPVALYVSFGALFGFTNTSIFRYFKSTVSPRFVHHSYRWSGICSQAGALLGSLIAFLIVVTGAL